MKFHKLAWVGLSVLSMLSQTVALAAQPAAQPVAVRQPVAEAADALPDSLSTVPAAADARALPADLQQFPELVEQRTANSATFQVGDDRYTSLVGADSLHYRDRYGQWQIIDPAFTNGQDGFLVVRNSIQSRAGYKTAWLSAAVGQTAVTWQATSLGTASGEQYSTLATQLPDGSVFAERLDAGRRLRYAGGWTDPALFEEIISAPDSLEQLLGLTAPPQAPAGSARTPDYLEMRGLLKLLPGATLWMNGEPLSAGEQNGAGANSYRTTGSLEIRDADGRVTLVFAPVRAFETAQPSTGVWGEYAAYPTSQPGTWTIGVRTPWRWWIDPARQYPAVIDPTMEVLQTTGYGGGLAWVCNSCIDSGSQDFQFGYLVLGSFDNSGSYKGYIQFNHLPLMETNNPISISAAYLDVTPVDVSMPYYKFEEDQYPSWKKYWTQTPATLYDLGQCPGACNGFSLAGGSFPGGLNWATSPNGASLGTHTLVAPPPAGGSPQTTTWDVTTRVRQWNQQHPRPANGPAFRLSLDTNCPTDDFVDDDDVDSDDNNGKWVPECTRMIVPAGNVRLRIDYDALPLVANGASLLNSPGIPSYLDGVFKDTTTNHQYALGDYAGSPRWRGVAVRANHAIDPTLSGWTNLKLFNQPASGDPVELAFATTQAADQTAFAVIDDHNATNPPIASADLLAEVVASNQNDLPTDEDRNYRIEYVTADAWGPQLGTRFTGTVTFRSDQLIELREFVVGADETVKFKFSLPATSTVQFALLTPTSGGQLGDAALSNKTNSDGLGLILPPGQPAPGNNQVFDDDFVPSVNGAYALALVNQGRPIQHPDRPDEGIAWTITISILRCPDGTIPTDKYECQPVVLPHVSIPGPYNYTTPEVSVLGVSLYNEGGFTGNIASVLCTHNEDQSTPIIGPDVDGRYIAVAQGSVCFNAATNTISTTVDSGVLLVISGNVKPSGETRGHWPSYVFNYGSTIYPLPANYKTGTMVRTTSTPTRLDPVTNTRRRVSPFDRWATVLTPTADNLNTSDMKAHGGGAIVVPVNIDASQPPVPTTWQVPWTIYPDASDTLRKYLFTVSPVQTPLYPLPTNLASLELRLLGPTVGALAIGDYWKTDLGPDLAQFRADEAKVTQAPKLGGASKNVQAVVLPPGEAREPDGIKGCGAANSCLDVRRDDYVWKGKVKVWELPDVHIQDDIGTVLLSRPGRLEVFSSDHPAASAVSQSFSMDTWGVTATVADEPCVEGGPVVTVIQGQGKIALPSMGSDGASGASPIEVTFKLCESKLNSAGITLDISPAKIPVGSSGLGVYLIGGTVTINPDNTVIELDLGFETLDGATLTEGDGKVTIDTAGMFSLDASGLLVGMLNAELVLQVAWEPVDVLLDAHVDCCGQLISGNLHMHAWIGQGWQGKYDWLEDDNAFHFSGSVDATLFIPEGYVADLGVTSLPPFDIQIGIKIAFGEFCTNSQCSDYAWGMSAVLTIAGYDVGLYVDTDGPEFILGTDDHVLIDQFQAFPQQASAAAPGSPAFNPGPSQWLNIIKPGNWQPFLEPLIATPIDDWPQQAAGDVCNLQPNVHTCPFEVDPGTGRALFTAGWENGSPFVVLMAPDNTIIGPNNAAAYGVTISATQSFLMNQVTYAVEPVSGEAIIPGMWKLRLSSLGAGLGPGAQHNYKLLFAADPPAPTLAFTTPASAGQTPNGSGLFNLEWTALRAGQPLTPASKIELFYTPVASKPMTPTEFSGIMLASEVLASDGSYPWNTSGLASGEYAVGGRIDDHLQGNTGVVAWAAGTVLINDTTAPPVPVVISPSIPLKDALIVRWERDLDTLDLAGYLVEYTIPQWDTSLEQLDKVRRVLPRGPIAVFDTWFYDQQWIRLGGLLNDETTEICVRAYDASGNVSGCVPFHFTLPRATPPRTGAPRDLNAAGAPAGMLTLTWTDPDFETPSAGYLVSYQTTLCGIPGAEHFAVEGYPPIDVGSTGRYVLTGLTEGQMYSITVRAYMADGFIGPAAGLNVMVMDPADDDGDSLPTGWERLYNAEDPTADLDSDGLSNLEEYRQATHPLWADSDSDGYYDADELGRGTGPCGPDHPAYPTLPKLSLFGKATLNFLTASNLPPGEEQTVDILNLGGGTLDWTAQASEPWITLGAAGGGDLASLPVGVNPQGLAPGSYAGFVTITSAPTATAFSGGAPILGETATIAVTLEVLSPKLFLVQMPVVAR